MQYIQYIEESQTWKCPKTGKYKVICVGGGGTGILYTTSTEVASQYVYQNGRPTSFGSYLTANGSQISNPKSTLCTDNDISSNDTNISNYTHIGGYGGYDGNKYGGNPESIFCNGIYYYYVRGSINSNEGGVVNYSPPEGNGGSLSDSSMSGNYGSGGFSKILVNKASKLSTLRFIYKAHYNAFTYSYQVSVPDSSPSGSHSETRTDTQGAGYVTNFYFGSGDFITSKELLPSNNLPLPTVTSVTTSQGTISKNIPIVKYVFDTAPVVSNTSAVVPLYPVKVRNNGCIKVDIIDLNEGDEIPCTIGSGGRALDAGVGTVTDKSYMNTGLSSESTVDFSGNIGDGSDGVIIIQFLGE